MSECDCIKGYTGFVLKKEVVVCGKCGKTAVEAALQAENAKLKAKLEAAEKFEKHIKAHLKDGEEVICKICGKTAKEISTLREKGE